MATGSILSNCFRNIERERKKTHNVKQLVETMCYVVLCFAVHAISFVLRSLLHQFVFAYKHMALTLGPHNSRNESKCGVAPEYNTQYCFGFITSQVREKCTQNIPSVLFHTHSWQSHARLTIHPHRWICNCSTICYFKRCKFVSYFIGFFFYFLVCSVLCVRARAVVAITIRIKLHLWSIIIVRCNSIRSVLFI